MAPKEEPPNLHVALVAEIKADAYCAAPTPDGKSVVLGEHDGPLRAYSTDDASKRLLVERARSETVNCALVANDGKDLWVGGASGDLTVYDAARGTKKVKPFQAHAKGVWCMCLGGNGKFVVTGGADFGVKVWNLNCDVLSASNHHSGAVKALCSFAGDENHPPAIWTGAQDGKTFRWSDDGDGLMEADEGSFLKGVGQSGVSAICGTPDNTEGWVGYESGRIRVFDRASGAVRNDMQRQKKTISALVSMGECVWSGSGDHTLVAWNTKSKLPVYSLPDQGGFIRGAIRVGWSMWVLTNKSVRVWAAESN